MGDYSKNVTDANSVIVKVILTLNLWAYLTLKGFLLLNLNIREVFLSEVKGKILQTLKLEL